MYYTNNTYRRVIFINLVKYDLSIQIQRILSWNIILRYYGTYFLSVLFLIYMLDFYFPMQHVELFHYERIAFKTVEKRFLPSRR